jgi:hypothetical protein
MSKVNTMTKTKEAKMDKAIEVITLSVRDFLAKHKLDVDLWTDENSEKLAKKLNMKRERDPNVPKRPLSGFMRFQAEVRNREGIKTKFPRSSDLAIEASRLWKELSAEEKAEYEEAYQEDLQKYKEMKGEAHTHSSDSDSGCSHSSSDGCHHVFPRGAKKGEVCGVVGCKKHKKEEVKEEEEDLEEVEEETCVYVYPEGHSHKGEKCGREREEGVYCKKHSGVMAVKEKVEREEREEREEKTKVKEVVCRYQFTRGANKGSMCGKVNCKLHE